MILQDGVRDIWINREMDKQSRMESERGGDIWRVGESLRWREGEGEKWTMQDGGIELNRGAGGGEGGVRYRIRAVY